MLYSKPKVSIAKALSILKVLRQDIKKHLKSYFSAMQTKYLLNQPISFEDKIDKGFIIVQTFLSNAAKMHKEI